MERILKSVLRWSPCLLEASPLEHVHPGLGKLPVLLQGANELWDFRVRWRGQHLQFSDPTEFRSIFDGRSTMEATPLTISSNNEKSLLELFSTFSSG